MMKKKFDDEVGMDNLITVAFKYPRSERIAIMGFLADYAHEFELEKEVVAKIYTLINEKSETPEKKHQAKHMPACFGYDKGIGLLRFLKEKGFVERSADPDAARDIGRQASAHQTPEGHDLCGERLLPEGCVPAREIARGYGLAFRIRE